MLHTQTQTSAGACTCGHNIHRHVVGICMATGCVCVREEEATASAAGPICERCMLRNRPARYRVRLQDMEMIVCESCAEATEAMGLRVYGPAIP